MYTGEFSHSIDAKGRLSVPSRFRTDEPGEKFYIVKSFDGCLFGYDSTQWSKILEKVMALPITTNPQAAAFVRFMFTGTAECEPDKLGRINLPEPLRKFAGLEDSASVVGVGTRFEIWSPSRWQEYNDTHMTPESIIGQIGSIGLEF